MDKSRWLVSYLLGAALVYTEKAYPHHWWLGCVFAFGAMLIEVSRSEYQNSKGGW